MKSDSLERGEGEKRRLLIQQTDISMLVLMVLRKGTVIFCI